MAATSILSAAFWRRLSCALPIAGLAGDGGAGVLRNPVPAPLADAVAPPGRPALRAWGESVRPGAVEAIIARQAHLLRARYGADIAAGRTPTLDCLALPGGRRRGALSAGILSAWSESGARPAFQGVRGDGAGAIIAPLSGVALSDTGPLKAEIAAERRKERRLSIGATNLDAGRPVIRDIDAIADSGHPCALAREPIRAFMACLYARAGDLFRAGRLWRDAPPFFATGLDAPNG